MENLWRSAEYSDPFNMHNIKGNTSGVRFNCKYMNKPIILSAEMQTDFEQHPLYFEHISYLCIGQTFEPNVKKLL